MQCYPDIFAMLSCPNRKREPQSDLARYSGRFKKAETAYQCSLPDLASQIVTGQIETSPPNNLQRTHLSLGHGLKNIDRNRIFKLLDKQFNDQPVHEELTETDE